MHRRKTQNPEYLFRSFEVSSFRARVRSSATNRRGEEPEIDEQAWLELRGALDEPVRKITAIRLSMHPQDQVRVGTARPPATGVIVGMRGEMDVVLSWSHREFDRVWALALAGALRYWLILEAQATPPTGLPNARRAAPSSC